MTRIEKLEAEIADYEKELEKLKAEIETLVLEKQKSCEKYSRVEKGKPYYSIAILGKGEPHIMKNFDKHKDNTEHTSDDEFRYNNNNYFKNVEEAYVMSESIKFLFKLRRLHDIYCPDYKPNWNDNFELKYFIEFDCEDNVYVWSCTDFYYRFSVYFPSEDIVIKVCDILNAELERNEENETMS